MEGKALESAGSLCINQIVIVGICVRNTTAAWRHTLESTLIKWLQKYEQSARSRHLLCVDQLLTAAKLAGGDEVLHVGDHHGDDLPGFGDAGDLGGHPDLHDLCLDLPEAGLYASLTGTFRDQNSRGAHHWVDKVAGPQKKLLQSTIEAGANDCLVEIHF